MLEDALEESTENNLIPLLESKELKFALLEEGLTPDEGVLQGNKVTARY